MENGRVPGFDRANRAFDGAGPTSDRPHPTLDRGGRTSDPPHPASDVPDRTNNLPISLLVSAGCFQQCVRPALFFTEVGCGFIDVSAIFLKPCHQCGPQGLSVGGFDVLLWIDRMMHGWRLRSQLLFEVFQPDRSRLCLDHGRHDHILQFPNVSRPRVLPGASLRAKIFNRLLLVAPVSPNQKADPIRSAK